MSNPWSLAGMIEEKRLKSTFVVASLCSTLINTFSASINLWDRMSERRKQKKKDSKQDDEIRQLKEQIAQVDKRSQKPEADNNRRVQDKGTDDDDGEALGLSLARSEALVRQEYNDGAGRLGKRFAMGDLITENQLQAQIITLQRTVIDVLQEALVNRQSLSHGDVQRLIAASLAARNGSLDALRQQYQRLSFEASPPQPRSLTSTSHSTIDVGMGELFCKYSLTLQATPGLPLSASFSPGGDGRCHYCGVQLDPETPDTYWHIEKRAAANAHDSKGDPTKEYHFDLGQRFIVKCHTGRGEYACVLCRRYGEIDIVCRSVPTLVNHVSKEHTVWELDADPDLRKGVSSPKTLPPPPGQEKRHRLAR
ncbi:hypothetical protein F5B22DRAFT_606829 [Xylaria bambusicola]|uniref:uncharacterized protein n=1 Tax=Xylaria bambusicola TaxID=326684 RepID=UPI002008629F|nr:uncharacterized protein F5B22DRAFT_606829 [Xylaria bambusicola]KAI0515334.1 hypothetical protein F5B22DRAFT_606829 [Xylaria bambusicola]